MNGDPIHSTPPRFCGDTFLRSRLYRHIGVCGAGGRFFRVLGERSDAYTGAPMTLVHGVDTGCLLATNDNETGKIGTSPSQLRRASAPTSEDIPFSIGEMIAKVRIWR
jgi:hypothetical protein